MSRSLLAPSLGRGYAFTGSLLMRQRGQAGEVAKGANQHSGIPLPSQAEAAAMLNVSVDTVKQAKAVQEKTALAVVQAVDAGELSVDAALPLTELPKEEQPTPAG